MDYKTASPDRYKLLKAFALENRKNPTLAEQVLWNNVRAEQLGVKVLRQQVIGNYIADFWIPNCNLIIEVDGLIMQNVNRRKMMSVVNPI